MDTVSYRFEQSSYHIPRCLHIKTPCKKCLQRHVLFRKYLCVNFPLQELSSETKSFTGIAFIQTISFAGTVLRNHIHYRNCLYRPYPLQEPSLQTLSFTGTVFADRILYRNYIFTDQILHIQELSFRTSAVLELILGNHNLSERASLQIFSKQHYWSYLNIQHKSNFL